MGMGSMEQESGELGARSKANRISDFGFRIADFEFGRICPIAKVLRAS